MAIAERLRKAGLFSLRKAGFERDISKPGFTCEEVIRKTEQGSSVARDWRMKDKGPKWKQEKSRL